MAWKKESEQMNHKNGTNMTDIITEYQAESIKILETEIAEWEQRHSKLIDRHWNALKELNLMLTLTAGLLPPISGLILGMWDKIEKMDFSIKLFIGFITVLSQIPVIFSMYIMLSRIQESRNE